MPADQDFGGALEFLKTTAVQKLRYMGETPMRPGLSIRVRARAKALWGPMPGLRIAGWAGRANGTRLGGVGGTGPVTQLAAYDEVVEASAIIGPGRQAGVDLVWTGADLGHLGVDLTGPSGGVVRVDDLVFEDVTHLFAADLAAVVDVRDFGARGDGTGDDAAAFEAADAAAGGHRTVLVPEGRYRIAGNVTFRSHVRFVGTVVPADAAKFILQRDFRFGAYLDALGDEELAFTKAFQSLLSFSDHDSLDLEDRRIGLSKPSKWPPPCPIARPLPRGGWCATASSSRSTGPPGRSGWCRHRPAIRRPTRPGSPMLPTSPASRRAASLPAAGWGANYMRNQSMWRAGGSP